MMLRQAVNGHSTTEHTCTHYQAMYLLIIEQFATQIVYAIRSSLIARLLLSIMSLHPTHHHSSAQRTDLICVGAYTHTHKLRLSPE